MFSGIVESCEKVCQVKPLDQAIRIWVDRPPFFNDLKVGDSIAVDGVCLTLEEPEWTALNLPRPVTVNESPFLQFTVGFETMKVLKRGSPHDWVQRKVNLERSLKFGDRIHGHFVTGHVEDMGQVLASYAQGENWMIEVQLPNQMHAFCWSKGSLTVNGVSLTINALNSKTDSTSVEHCLIPETQKRTNLSQLKVGDFVCLEVDSMVRTLFEGFKNGFLNAANIEGLKKLLP